MQPGDRLVCAFVRPNAVGHSFKRWPLHVTIVPWFRADTPTDELAAEMQQALQDIPPFEVVMDGKATFGHNKTVRLVQQPTPFNAVESRVRAVLKRHKAWIADETTKRRRPFQPHVTDQADARLSAGDRFQCDELSIIEQKGSHKVVAATVGLGNGKSTA
jgi:2'-5' RNA ligase